MYNNTESVQLFDVGAVKSALIEFDKAQKSRSKREKSSKKQSGVSSAAKNYSDSKATSRAFCCETYIERQYLDKFIINAPFIKHWAICTHDMDIVCDDEGNRLIDEATGECQIKGEHTHFLLYTYSSKTASAIRKIFDRYSKSIYIPLGIEPQNTLTQICADMVVQWRYLIHQDEYGRNGKVPYPAESRICDDIKYWCGLEKSYGLIDFDKNRALSMYADFKAGLSHEQLLMMYGTFYLQNVNKLHTMLEYPTRDSYKERKKKK